MDFNQGIEFIEAAIRRLNVDPAACKGEKVGQYTLTYKGSTVWIDLFNFETAPDKNYLQLMSPLCRLPDKRREEFAENILEINHNLYGCWMSKKNDSIYVMNLRELDGYDATEIDATLDRVGFYSSDYWSKLSFKYEGCWLPKENSADNTPGPSGN